MCIKSLYVYKYIYICIFIYKNIHICNLFIYFHSDLSHSANNIRNYDHQKKLNLTYEQIKVIVTL